jgi:EF hand domain-containing protein
MLTSKHASIALVTAAVGLCLFILGVALAHADNLGFLAESMFDRLDADHNGVISLDEAKGARGRMFEKIDADHNGVVTAAEIQAAKENAEKRRAKRMASLAKLRAEMPAPSERFAELDQNHDGKVTRDEFISARSWFDVLAKSGGGISKADFANFLDAAR